MPLALAARERGAIIHVAAPGASNDEALQALGFGGHELPFSQKSFSAAGGAANIRAIKKLLLDIRPDVVHTITLKYCFLTGLAARGIRGPKFVFTIAGLGYLFSRQNLRSRIMNFALAPLVRRALRHPDAVVTFQNPDDMKILIDEGFVRAESSTLIRGSGVDLGKYTPRADENHDLPLVVMPTRLVHDKGISVFIDVAKILEKRQISARLQIAGGVTDHNPLAITKAEMESLVANSPVEWLGKVTDMPALYNKATLIVYPSWYREGIPRVLLEAAAMGKAIVTTDHPGCREAVAHNDNGLLVPVRDIEATADAVEKLLKDADLRRRMESRSRERAENEFDVALIADQTLKIYGF